MDCKVGVFSGKKRKGIVWERTWGKMGSWGEKRGGLPLGRGLSLEREVTNLGEGCCPEKSLFARGKKEKSN